MKTKFFITIAIFLCFLILFGFAITQIYSQESEKKEARTITTQGEAKVWIEPDRARVYLGLETLNEVIELARQENAEKMKKIMSTLASLEIKDMVVKAPDYSVILVREPEHEATRARRLPEIIGYKVKQDFTVLLKNDDVSVLSKNASQVVDIALVNGVNIISNVEFFKEDDSKSKLEALALAVKNAIANAEEIAKTAGVKIKAYNMINSTTNYYLPNEYKQNQILLQQFEPYFSDTGAATTRLATGKIAVRANVTISCLIED